MKGRIYFAYVDNCNMPGRGIDTCSASQGQCLKHVMCMYRYVYIELHG